MSEFWDKVNADYVAAGGEIRPEVWGQPARPANRGPVRFKEGVAQDWRHGAEPVLSPVQDREAREMYESGKSCAQVAERFRIGKNTARDAILRAGGEMRQTGRRPNKLSADQRTELTKRYAAGESLTPLSEDYGISRTTAARVVRAEGGEVRGRAESMQVAQKDRPNKRKKLTDEQAQEIRRRYEARESLMQIGAVFGMAHKDVGKVVVAQGGTLRSRSEAQRIGTSRLPAEKVTELLRRYDAGESINRACFAVGICFQAARRAIELSGRVVLGQKTATSKSNRDRNNRERQTP